MISQQSIVHSPQSTVNGSSNCRLWTLDYGPKTGFTLIEVLVVLVIFGFMLAMMPRIFTGYDAQQRFDETRERMLDIKKAILGSPGAYVNGQRQFAGYITDMGELPELNREGQPESLWKKGALPSWGYGNTSKIWIGWRGPYMEEPPGSVLRDGWGNPFAFVKGPSVSEKIEEGDMKIKSLGADGREGGKEYDEDIELLVRETEYMGAVAGQVDFGEGENGNVRVQICYPSSGMETNKVIEGVDHEGYFRFEKGAQGEGEADLNIPSGVRRIVASVAGIEKELIFCVEPTGNWLGTLKLEYMVSVHGLKLEIGN